MIRHLFRARRASKPRRLAPTITPLEARELLSTTALTGLTASPMYDVGALARSTAVPAGADTPAQIAQAYGFNEITFGSVQGTGAGETIAIVDAYSDTHIQADLNTFDTQFGLPSTTVTQVNESGGSSLPGADPTGGWELEESLDVEWAHAMAPGANIVLVAASSASDTDLLNAVNTAAKVGNVVSMSWGGSEFSGEQSYDADFSKAGVAFVASSGDSGPPASWPSSSPNVISVGGTSLTLSANGTWEGESGWSGSTGGASAYETQPAYQKGVVTQTTTKRAEPDVAFDANPNTGVAVYDSVAYEGTTYDWLTVGGTSAGAPQWSALLAIADQGRTLSTQSALDATSPQGVQTTLYQNATSGDFHDITTGTSVGGTTRKPIDYSAGVGYDYVTGLGSPVANLVVQSLDGSVSPTPTPTPSPTPTPTPTPSDTLAISAPTTATAGTAFSVTVTALNSSDQTDTGYTGTVHFTSTDAQAVLPSGNVTLTNGVGTFSVTLKTVGSETVTVTDTSSGNHATTSGIADSPATPTSLVATAVSSSQINLSWTASAGATGYLIQDSTNDSSWSQIGTSATTTYSATSLAAGTTYYFRVQATGGAGSAYSNTASATTTGGITNPGTGDTIWSNSYTPSENEYSEGSYDVGVKFTTSEAGTVTGARFYKQTWMNGPTHIGYLWSATGQKLASATFTNETSYGWEQVSFSSPVAISANTVYIVSFSTGGGYFGITSGFFSSSGVTNGPLTALKNGTSGGDGVYGSGNATFPSVSGAGMNFWADVVFSPTTNPSVSTGAGAGGGNHATTFGSSYVVVTTNAPTGSSSVSAPQGDGAAPTWPYHNTVPPAQTLASTRPNGSIFGPGVF